MGQDSFYEFSVEELNSMLEYKEYYENTDEILSPEGLDGIRNICSNH